jgi:4-hydroxybenzoate polyprenyltransferase
VEGDLKRSSSLVAWLQLLRLPNVFTAAADVTMGYIVTQRDLEPYLHLALLVAASCSLYLSGMVLNDVFDAEVDAREQPHRPIPSGRVSLYHAQRLGWGLWLIGIALAWLCSHLANDWRPGAVASALALVILAYNGALKNSRAAPLLMGECRFLNVLLGMSLFVWRWERRELLIAAGIGIYIIGVTVFSRTDAHVSKRTRLIIGYIEILAGLGILAALPVLTYNRPPLEFAPNSMYLWYLLWGAIALIIARRCVIAILEPTPPRVQAAVRHCVQSIIVLDAAVCLGYAGAFWGFALLALLIPTYLLTQWLNAT